VKNSLVPAFMVTRWGSSSQSSSSSGDMSVREAGHKGGQKVRELIEKGKQRSSER
jgi:hypothetical protein